MSEEVDPKPSTAVKDATETVTEPADQQGTATKPADTQETVTTPADTHEAVTQHKRPADTLETVTKRIVLHKGTPDEHRGFAGNAHGGVLIPARMIDTGTDPV